MSKDEALQAMQLLHDMGFKVEWVDAEAETFLVRANGAR